MSMAELIIVFSMWAIQADGDFEVPVVEIPPVQQQGLASEEVLAWEPSVVNLVDTLDPSVVLSLIHIESTGNPAARRAGSRYYGLLQISDMYIYDALDVVGSPREPASTLRGEGVESIRVFVWYMTRYEFLHNWEPEKVVVLHKVGPTAFQRIQRRMAREGVNFSDSVCRDSTPNACEYLERYRRYYEIYYTLSYSTSKSSFCLAAWSE